ncbi:NAD(P)H-hydrate dehydratase [Brassicibacter mesophilus]|uniref:NAD(P)H-hydrate dehydratase n=1 Tax=Brassicibacter mesophilus TaxID=745119 RepID=UPI003D1A8FB1
MIKGCGIDIIEIERIKEVIEINSKFMTRVFCESEIAYINSRKNNINTIAGIFAAKEAISKAIGSGIRDFKWTDIEIYHDSLGKPLVKLNRNAERTAKNKGIDAIYLSITHDKDKAAAIAIAEGNVLFEKLSTKPVRSFPKSITVVEKEFVHDKLPKRKKDTHKGTYGRIGIIAGSKGMTGAVYLSSIACLKSGSGLVYSIVPSSISDILEIKLTEAIIVPIEDKGRGYFIEDSIEKILNESNNCDCIAIGPGIGVDDERIEVVRSLLLYVDKPIVLDADGLNCISSDINIIKKRKASTVVTPHPGELSRLLNVDIKYIQANRVKYCKMASEKLGVITVLKGADSVICSENGDVFINETGNPGMATAGSGDVLTGMISSFIGQGISPLHAAVCGTYLHGLSGDIAVEDKGEYGLIATDIVANIPYAIKYIQTS